MIPPSLRGTQNDGLAHACDWFATFREIAKVDPQGSATAIDSLSLRGMLFSQAKSPRTSIVHESVPGEVPGVASFGKIRSGDWNLYLGNPGKPFLLL